MSFRCTPYGKPCPFVQGRSAGFVLELRTKPELFRAYSRALSSKIERSLAPGRHSIGVVPLRPLWFNPGSPFPYGCTYTPGNFGPPRRAGTWRPCPSRRTPTGRRSRSLLPPTTRVPPVCDRTTNWDAREYGFGIGTSCIPCLSPNYFSCGFGRAACIRSSTFDPGGDAAGCWRSASSAS